MPNSRLHPRAPFFSQVDVLAEVDVLAAEDALPRRVWGKDLSETGVFLQTTQPLHPGARVSLRFDVDGTEVHVRAAEVVWVRAFEPINVNGEAPGVGVRFLSVDPPLRAAIRRFVHKSELAASMTDDSLLPLPATLSAIDAAPPPAPPPFPELSGPLELSPLSMPPVSLPPVSLPPLSMPPLSTPPASLTPRSSLPAPTSTLPSFAVSLPPFDSELMPAPAELAEAREDDDEHPLAGWRFEVIEQARDVESSFADVSRAEPGFSEASFSGPNQLGGPVEDPERPEGRLGLSFDDAPPERLALPPRGASLEHQEPAEAFSTPPSLLEDTTQLALSLEAQERREASFADGNIALLELARAEPRKAAPTRRAAMGSSRHGWAAGLLAAGGAVGLLVGWGPGAAPAAPAEIAEVAEAPTEAEPQPVFVAERALLDDGADEPVKAAPVTPATEESPTKESATRESATKESPTRDAAAVRPRREETSLASALPPPVEEKTPRDARVEWGRVTLPLEGGRVDRTFTLASPPRVVVDLVDARYPGNRNDAVFDKGVARLRIGRPDPSHVRVVVELEGERQPKEPSVLKRDHTLAIAWR